jgi:triosephosphate isomerase (TIM)
MTPGIRPLVAGNWKMNGTGESLGELTRIARGFGSGLEAETDALVCLPATLLSRAARTLETGTLHLGGQDCHPAGSGAHTGDISAEMLKDAGAEYVIVGHSERRADHGETDALVRAKAEAAWRAILAQPGQSGVVGLREGEMVLRAIQATPDPARVEFAQRIYQMQKDVSQW